MAMIPPSCRPSLSEEMLPTAAVMESSCRRRQSLCFNGKQSSAGWMHTYGHRHGLYSRISLKIVPFQFFRGVRWIQSRCRSWHTTETKCEAGMRGWEDDRGSFFFLFNIEHCQETTCSGTSQCVELSIRVPLLEEADCVPFPRSVPRQLQSSPDK